MRENSNIFLKLFEQSGTKLHGMIYRLTLDTHAAEDLMQELCCRLCQLKNPQQYDNLEAYACRMAINLAFDWRRQKRSLKRIPEGMVDEKNRNAEVRLIEYEQVQQILNAARMLKGLSRECFVLRYIEQMDYSLIAERTQKTPQHVRALCSKAIQRIRQILNTETPSMTREAVNE
ncbi:MAG: RNA polymerase sigma factor [Planctomycetota bacterium]